MQIPRPPVQPLIAVPVGDPAGIGPEVSIRAAADPAVTARARLVLIGPPELRPEHVPEIDSADVEQPEAPRVAWLAAGEASGVVPGRAQAAGGAAALAALRLGHDLALAGRVDALVTAPVSKEALHLAGERVEGQTQLLTRWSGEPFSAMVALAHDLRVLLLTRHLPLRAALDAIDGDAIVRHLELFHATLSSWGFGRPRLALAGWNPHAGEHGLLGREDAEILVPAAERARALGLDVAGPVSPDTVFLRASRREFDGVLALYHDQAFIPVKLHAPDSGLTVLAGLPYLRVSPAHGTAFDLVGTGRASPRNLVEALTWAAAHAPARPREAPAAPRGSRPW